MGPMDRDIVTFIRRFELMKTFSSAAKVRRPLHCPAEMQLLVLVPEHGGAEAVEDAGHPGCNHKNILLKLKIFYTFAHPTQRPVSELDLEHGEVVPHCALGDGDGVVERGLVGQPEGDGGPRQHDHRGSHHRALNVLCKHISAEHQSQKKQSSK